LKKKKKKTRELENEMAPSLLKKEEEGKFYLTPWEGKTPPRSRS